MNIQTTWKAGQSSLGAARKIERELMDIALADIAATVARIRGYAKTSEVMDRELCELAQSITDAAHDASVTASFWEAKIAGME